MSRPYNTRPLTKQKYLHTNDALHKSIRLCPLSIELVNTPHFQRLRKLKQLGTSEYTYVNANHTRFEHSLGVGHLSRELLDRIRKEQPKLDICDLDVKCVEIAGYCHDLGHGCFSHVYDGGFKHQLSKAIQTQSWMGHAFDHTSMYDSLPRRPEGWAHEDDSLMMLDHMLAYLGLAVDEENLDKPLRQIGDGVDANLFGTVDSSTGKLHVLTSRDAIFIKECIAGGPLPKRGMSIEGLKKSMECVEYVGRPDPNKEFLYDIVSNKHSGFDFDKSFGFKGFEQCVLERLFDNACVAWSDCVNPKKCFRCKHKTVAGKHLMICWPQKLVPTVREFFRERFLHHLNIYRHPTTQACTFMVCDILILADPHLKLSTENELAEQADNGNITHLSISRANNNPNSYLKLDDSIFDLIHKSTDPNLRPARQLINRMKRRKLYKLCGELDIEDEGWEHILWEMTETEITSEIMLFNDSSVEIQDHSIIVEKRGIHHGMGAVDPVSCVRFVQGDQSDLNEAPCNLPTAVQMKVHSCLTPKSFLMKTVRVYCRVDDSSVVQQIQTCFGKLCRFLEEKAKYNTTPAKTQALEIEAEVNETSDFNVLTQSPILNDDQSPLPSLGKRSSSRSFYSQAVKRKIVDDMK